MPFFSRPKSSKSASKQAPEEPAKPKPAPYRHVPTHAASDSIAVSPAGSRSTDRLAIQDAHHRRLTSRSNSSQSLVAYASSNSLLIRRNNSTLTMSSAAYASSALSAGDASSISRHPGFAAYDMLDGARDPTVLRAGTGTGSSSGGRSHGRSPLSSPPLSPVGSDASDSGERSSSATSIDFDASLPEERSSQSATSSRHHSRKNSTALKLTVRSKPTPMPRSSPPSRSTKNLPSAKSTSSDDGDARRIYPGAGKAIAVVATRPLDPPRSPVPHNAAATTSADPAPASISSKRHGRFALFGRKAGAIVTH